jgi:hypothetical protein
MQVVFEDGEHRTFLERDDLAPVMIAGNVPKTGTLPAPSSNGIEERNLRRRACGISVPA